MNATTTLREALEARLDEVKTRVEHAKKHAHRDNEHYHAGEAAALNYVLGQIAEYAVKPTPEAA